MKNKNLKKIIIFAVALVILIVVAAVSGIFDSFAAFMDGIKMPTADTLLNLLIMVSAGLLITYLLVMIFDGIKAKSGRAKTVLSIMSSLVKYICFLVILIWGLSIIGVNVSTIFASVGILTLIVGFSAESLIADVITGAFMLFENQYNVGDIIEVAGFRGTVTSIGIRTTCIKDVGDNVKIVNNSEMKNILNKSNDDSKAVCDIPVSYDDNLEQIESCLDRILEKATAEHPDVFRVKPTYVGVQSLSDSAVVLRVVARVDECSIYSAARLLNREILLGLGKSGFRVPFPQMDIHNK